MSEISHQKNSLKFPSFRKGSVALIFCILFFGSANAQNCPPDGNVVIFSNYEGGELIIDVNQDIPNLKIGIASYEPTAVTLTGPFVGNVNEVIYAGYQPALPGNNSCGGVDIASVDGIINGTLQVLDTPPVTLISPDVEVFPGFFQPAGSNSGITGCSTCSNDTYQGGSNTAEQIIDFFLTQFGGNLRFLKTQYSCWCGTQDLNQPATCCFELTNEETVFIQASPETTLCSGPVTLDAGPGYETYDWSTGETSQTIVVDEPGSYEVAVTSECGQASDAITIAPCEDEFFISLEDLSVCAGEEVEIIADVTGGVAPFTFEWLPDFGTGPGPFLTEFTDDSVIDVTVTDADGNVASATALITVVTPPQVDLGPEQDLCQGNVILDAGIQGADVLWSTGETTTTIEVSDPGTYNVTVQNQCGVASDEITIEECPEELTVTLEGGVICEGETFDIIAEVSGGIEPYSYSWTPALGDTAGPVELSLSNTTTYEVTVTDAEGNTATTSATVEVVTENLNIELGPNQAYCDEPIILDASNPDASSYTWNTGETTSQITVNEPGTYSITLTGECGTFQDEITIVECDALLILLENDTVCLGETISLEAEVSGGEPPYTYSWSPNLGNGLGPFNISPEFDQNYTLIVTDSEGETAQANALITVLPTELESDLPDSVNVCPGDIFTLNAETANATNYMWNTGSTEPILQSMAAGTYVVEISSVCATITEEIQVNFFEEIEDLLINREILTCEDNLPLNIGPRESDAYNLLWSTGEFSDNIQVVSPGVYQANYSSTCRDTTLTWRIETEDCDCEIFVPNAFSPDFNGINDSFKPEVNCEVTSYEFAVYNRWGKEVFRSDDPEAAWRGESADENYFGGIGVYFWKLELEPDLQSIVPETIKRQGSVTIVR